MNRPAMRIALVAGEDPGWGGIGTYTGELARALAAEGQHVELVLRGWEEDTIEDLDGLTVHRVTVPPPVWRRGTVALLSRAHMARESLVFSARVAQRLARLHRARRLEVVEAPEFHAPGLVASLGAHALRVAGRAPLVVARLHGPGFLTARLAGSPSTADARMLETLERAAVRSARLVTSPSAAMLAEVTARWGGPQRSTEIVPNPIDTQRYAPSAVAPDRAMLLIVGRIERAKGQDVAVEALPSIRRAVPGAQLLLVGADSDLAAGGGSALAALHRRAAELGMPEDALEAIGAVERSELPALYARASACLVPSRFEAFGYTCLEAMACGRPVIASAAGGLNEIVTSGHDGLLTPPGDAGALARAAVRLLVDPDLSRRLGDSARATVVERFAAPVIAGRMSALYTDAAAAARADG
jgi:glycosyltransferase involved in cell wall biosynthesis